MQGIDVLIQEKKNKYSKIINENVLLPYFYAET